MKHDRTKCIVCKQEDELLLTDRRVSGKADRRGERGDRRKPPPIVGDIDPDETVSMEEFEKYGRD